jgi:hypothetical protein
VSKGAAVVGRGHASAARAAFQQSAALVAEGILELPLKLALSAASLISHCITTNMRSPDTLAEGVAALVVYPPSIRFVLVVGGWHDCDMWC